MVRRIDEAMKKVRQKTYQTEFGPFTIYTSQGKRRDRDIYGRSGRNAPLVTVTSIFGTFDNYPEAITFFVESDYGKKYVSSSQGDSYMDWVRYVGASNYDNARDIVDEEIVKCFQDYYNDNSIY